MTNLDEVSLDRHFHSQLKVLAEVRCQQEFSRTDLSICDKWLEIFNTTGTTNKYARNCLMLLMYSQMMEAGGLGKPFTDMRNCALDLDAVLDSYHGKMEEDGFNCNNDYIFDLNDVVNNTGYSDDDDYDEDGRISRMCSKTYTIERHSVITSCTSTCRNENSSNIARERVVAGCQMKVHSTSYANLTQCTTRTKTASCDSYPEKAADSEEATLRQYTTRTKTASCASCPEKERENEDEGTTLRGLDQTTSSVRATKAENDIAMNSINERMEKLRAILHSSPKHNDGPSSKSNSPRENISICQSIANHNINDSGRGSANASSDNSREKDSEYWQQLNNLETELAQLPEDPNAEQQLNVLKQNIKLVLQSRHAAQQENAMRKLKLRELLAAEQEKMHKLMQLIRLKQFVLDECQDKLQSAELVLSRFDEEFEDILAKL